MIDVPRLDNYMMAFSSFCAFSFEIDLFPIKFLYHSCEIPVYLWATIRFARYSNLYLVFLFTMILDFDSYLFLVEKFDSYCT
jgi:hypothetical protein